MLTIDLNCDLGESYEDKIVGNDEAVFPYISSCNIACGAHGGDPITTERTIELAIQYNVQIGAHPSYPDLAGFGRKEMRLTAPELKATIKAQIKKIYDLCIAHGTKMKYVKAHGALYNKINQDKQESEIVVRTVKDLDKNLAIMGLPNSTLQEVAEANGMHYIKEGFIDRLYQEDGSLTPRDVEGAVFEKTDDLLAQFRSLIAENKVETASGKLINMEVDSVCIHGDNPHVVPFLEALQKELKLENIQIKRSLA